MNTKGLSNYHLIFLYRLDNGPRESETVAGEATELNLKLEGCINILLNLVGASITFKRIRRVRQQNQNFPAQQLSETLIMTSTYVFYEM